MSKDERESSSSSAAPKKNAQSSPGKSYADLLRKRLDGQFGSDCVKE